MRAKGDPMKHAVPALRAVLFFILLAASGGAINLQFVVCKAALMV